MDLRRIIIIALFASLMVAGAYIAVPIGPVPITLQTAFVLLSGILAGRGIAVASVAIYLTIGAIGLPVFSGGIGGFGHFVGPTGGFLLSWLVAAPVTGFFADLGFKKDMGEKVTRSQLLWIILGAVAGTVVLYLVGIPFLKMVLELSWGRALAIGLVPFIPGDLVKLVAVVILGNLFAPRVRTFLRDGQSAKEAPDASDT